MPNPRYMRILLYLKNHGPKPSSEIARTLGYSDGFTRRALQFLRRAGAVEVFWRPRKGLESFKE